MAATPLLSRQDFLTNHVSAVDKCSICLEFFDSEHKTIQSLSPHANKHIFGEAWLRDWLQSDHENANKCPNCRQVLSHHVTKVGVGTNSRMASAYHIADATVFNNTAGVSKNSAEQVVRLLNHLIRR